MEEFSSIVSASAASAGEFKSPENIWLALAESARSEEAEAADTSSHDYRPELATPELIVQIRRLLAAERRAGRLVCRYLADLADRIHGQRDAELCAYVDEFHAAACFFDLGAREVRERVRVGRALRQLPQMDAAFVAGELSYSRVREVTRVAQPNTESEWLQRARGLDMRSLERQVAGEARQLGVAPRRFDVATGDDRDGSGGSCERADGGFDPANCGSLPAEAMSAGKPDERTSRDTPREPARLHVRWLDRDSLRVTFEMSADAWALVERALEGARQKAATPLADADALAAVARDALAAQNQSADASDPRHPLASFDDTRASPAPVQPQQSPDPADCPTDDTNARATHFGSLNEPAARLLQIMGRHGNWTPNDLLEKSALPLAELQHALLLLELEGRVRRRGYEIDPV